MRIEHWYGNEIRFVEKDGEWWAILKDICDALHLRSKDVSQRLDTNTMERVQVEIEVAIPSKYKKDEDGINDVDFTRTTKTQWMIGVNEIGIYEALFASRRLEARKFRMWSANVMQKLRKKVGLNDYEALRMTEPDIQDDIDHILDTLYWDEEQKCVMQSITVQGGDVEQVVFC